MSNKLVASLSLAVVTALAGCGSSSSAPEATPPPATPPGTTTTPPSGDTGKVVGPMDAIQTPLSAQVIAPLVGASAGTPLYGVMVCVDRIVVVDALDVVDSVALGVQATNPSALAGSLTADNLQNQLQNTVVDLSGMLSALRGDSAGCTRNALPTGTNPLAGTPLESVGAQLAPVLDQIFDAVAGDGTSARPDLSLATLVGLYGQLDFAVQLAFSQVPAEVSSAPVLGDAIRAVSNAMGQLNAVVVAAAANNPAAAQAAIAAAMNSTLRALLLDVVPVRAMEAQAGQAGVLSGPMTTGIDTVTAQLAGTNLDTLQPQALQAALTAALAPVLDPVQDSVLGSILAPLFDALGGVTAPAGDPLGQLTAALEGFLDGGPTPLLYITSTIEQVIALGGACPTAGTPLDVLCTLDLGLPPPPPPPPLPLPL